MAGWDLILKEIGNAPSQTDMVRRRYLSDLHSYTNRNVIAYYSGWLTHPKSPNTDINDADMSGFMNAIKEMETSLGLDLILHTPGGTPTAAEGIVTYLRSKFGNDIRIIVPHLAMSAGTMMACAGKVILMGKESSLGPIDPQINGIPALNIIREFETARAELSAPDGASKVNYWKIILEQYPAGYAYICSDALTLSEELTKQWLLTGMLEGVDEKESIASRIVGFLNDHDGSKVHARHYNFEKCRSIGLKIDLLEDDQTLQDLVLSIHHAFSLTMATTNSVKIIENHRGKAMVAKVNEKQ